MKSEDDRKFLCSVCGMGFRRNDIKRRHEITHSKEYRYFCAICGKGFIRRYVLVKHLTRDHNTSDSKEIVYQNKKKDNEKQLVPTTVDESEEQNSLADLQQLENDVEMKATEEGAEQSETTFSLVATDDIPEGSEVVQLQGIVEEDDEQTMEKENEQQIVENQIAATNHQIVTEAQISVAEHQMSQIPQDQIPQNQIQVQVSEIDENDANIHVTAILTSSLEEKPIIKDIQVKDEGTQIT